MKLNQTINQRVRSGTVILYDYFFFLVFNFYLRFERNWFRGFLFFFSFSVKKTKQNNKRSEETKRSFFVFVYFFLFFSLPKNKKRKRKKKNKMVDVFFSLLFSFYLLFIFFLSGRFFSCWFTCPRHSSGSNPKETKKKQKKTR